MYFKYTPMYSKELIQKRAGNAKSVTFPCETVPKGIQGLQDCEPYTGHDSYLGMAYGIIDCIISKRLRCLLLLKYGKYMSVSSSSLMHKPELGNGVEVDDLSADFAYGITFSCNLRLIKLIVAEWRDTEQSEIRDFIINLENILRNEGIAIPSAKKPLCLKPYSTSGRRISIRATRLHEPDIIEFWGDVNLIILEQLLRYSKELIWIDPDWIVNRAYSVKTLGEKGICASVVMTREQAETIISQRNNHKRQEWLEICTILKEAI